jgi:hypothetical protein
MSWLIEHLDRDSGRDAEGRALRGEALIGEWMEETPARLSRSCSNGCR